MRQNRLAEQKTKEWNFKEKRKDVPTKMMLRERANLKEIPVNLPAYEPNNEPIAKQKPKKQSSKMKPKMKLKEAIPDEAARIFAARSTPILEPL